MEESTGLLFVGDTSITECKESEKNRSFYPRESSGRTTRERRDAHGTRLGRGGKEGKKKRKEGKKRNGRLKKLVLPVTQNRDAAVGRGAARNKSRARLLRTKSRRRVAHFMPFASLSLACARTRTTSRCINRAIVGSKVQP